MENQTLLAAFSVSGDEGFAVLDTLKTYLFLRP